MDDRSSVSTLFGMNTQESVALKHNAYEIY